MKCGWQATGARGSSGLLRTEERQSRARRQAQAAAGSGQWSHRRAADCWGSADGGAGLAQGADGLSAGATHGSERKEMEMRRGRGGGGGGGGGEEGKKPFYKAAWATERS